MNSSDFQSGAIEKKHLYKNNRLSIEKEKETDFITNGLYTAIEKEKKTAIEKEKKTVDTRNFIC